jgi:hypothetical protein
MDDISETYMILSIVYMILCTAIILYERRKQLLSAIYLVQAKIGKIESIIKNKRYFAIFVVVFAVLVSSYIFSHEKPLEITFNKIEDIFSEDSVLVFSEELNRDDCIHIVDIFWAWGRAGLNRPDYSLNYPDCRKKAGNLICLVSEKDTMFDHLMSDLGIEEKYEEQGLEKSNVNSLAMLTRFENADYLIICENEQRGLGVATLYLSNPANWQFHDKESILFFLWGDYNGDNEIQVNEIDVKPRKNQFFVYTPYKEKETQNQLFLEFKKDAAIILGANLNKFDLLSAGNIVWSLSYFTKDLEKPRILCDYEEIYAKNMIIVGGPDANNAAEIVCGALNLNAAFDSEHRTFEIQIGNKSIEISKEKLNVDDICIIALERIDEGNIILVAGLEGNGTYIGSVFLSQEKNWNSFDGENSVLILGWNDTNDNERVEPEEISVRFQIKGENADSLSSYFMNDILHERLA